MMTTLIDADSLLIWTDTHVCLVSPVIHILCVWFKPKFYYSNFATKSMTFPRQSCGLCCGHKSRKSATQIMLPTFMIYVADFCDLCSRQNPRTKL